MAETCDISFDKKWSELNECSKESLSKEIVRALRFNLQPNDVDRIFAKGGRFGNEIAHFNFAMFLVDKFGIPDDQVDKCRERARKGRFEA